MPLDPALAELRRQGVERLDMLVVLGSGLGGVADQLRAGALSVPYAAVPGMPAGRVPGHAGEFRFDAKRGLGFALGRVHLYQGYSAKDVVFPVRLAAALGATRLIVTNAAGSVRREIVPGSIVSISDHINLTGTTPLDFSDLLTTQAEFVPMVDAYAPQLREAILRIASELEIPIGEGVYAGVSGPAYETPAEVRMLASMGASVVGMSTVLEVIAARALGLEVCGLSLVTNYAGTHGTHAEVLEASTRGASNLGQILGRLL